MAVVLRCVGPADGRVVTGLVVVALCTAITLLLVAAYVLAEVDYETRRDVRRLRRHEEARRRLSHPRSLR